MIGRIIDPKAQGHRLGIHPDGASQAHDLAVGSAFIDNRLAVTRHRQQPVVDLVIGRGHNRRGRTDRARRHRCSYFIVVQGQCRNAGAGIGLDIVPAHPRPPAFGWKPAVIADDMADAPSVCRNGISQRLQAGGGAIGRAGQPRFTPALQHDIHHPGPGRLQPHAGAGGRRLQGRQIGKGSGGDEQLGVGRRDEPLIRVDGEQRFAFKGRYHHAIACAGGTLRKDGFDHRQQRRCGLCGRCADRNDNWNGKGQKRGNAHRPS